MAHIPGITIFKEEKLIADYDSIRIGEYIEDSFFLHFVGAGSMDNFLNQMQEIIDFRANANSAKILAPGPKGER
jgi:hypothetical protein